MHGLKAPPPSKASSTGCGLLSAWSGILGRPERRRRSRSFVDEALAKAEAAHGRVGHGVFRSGLRLGTPQSQVETPRSLVGRTEGAVCLPRSSGASQMRSI